MGLILETIQFYGFSINAKQYDEISKDWKRHTTEDVKLYIKDSFGIDVCEACLWDYKGEEKTNIKVVFGRHGIGTVVGLFFAIPGTVTENDMHDADVVFLKKLEDPEYEDWDLLELREHLGVDQPIGWKIATNLMF